VEIGEDSTAGLNRSGNAGKSTGVEAGDWDGDGYMDLWATGGDAEPPALYRSVAPDLFFNITEQWGLNSKGELPSGWGAVTADLDCDQDLDFLIANGQRPQQPSEAARAQRPQLLENSARVRFSDAVTSAASFFQGEMQARAVAVGDLDNDGDLDAVFTRLNAPAAILQNDLPSKNGAVQVRLIGVYGTRWPSGVRLHAVTADSEQELLWRSGNGYLSTHDPRIHIGVGSNQSLKELRIAWPGRPVSTLRDSSGGKKVVVFEP
jgi:hypothetical protein